MIDTRRLTKKIRTEGSMLCKIEFNESIGTNDDIDFWDPNYENLAAKVSCSIVREFIRGDFPTVLVIDCGIKNSII